MAIDMAALPGSRRCGSAMASLDRKRRNFYSKPGRPLHCRHTGGDEYNRMTTTLFLQYDDVKNSSSLGESVQITRRCITYAEQMHILFGGGL